MEAGSAYIPMDRRGAIASADTLPTRSTGAALFADISGFTPLTEALLRAYGPRRGAEELSQQLNQVYDALVAEVHRYGGSVIGFSGDAMTCWIDGDAGLQAAACGLAMQGIMQQFKAIDIPGSEPVALAMKVAVATGPVRRFQIGDPQIQLIDALAGKTLEVMAAAEHLAERGEVVLSPGVVAHLSGLVNLTDERVDPDYETPFGVLQSLHPSIGEILRLDNSHDFTQEQLTQEEIKPWLLPPVYDRLQGGRGDFLAELRPAVILFLRFSGIDYDGDEAAGEKLDEYIRRVQNILVRYESYLLQLTIGDKGSYIYAAFGAPIAHEDDGVRAVAAALELQTLSQELDFIEPVQIGLSHGQLRTGAYGGTRRRTYGVLGDDVNLAARLMQASEPQQILVSASVRALAGDSFIWEELSPIRVKGKSQAIEIYSPQGRRQYHQAHLTVPDYTLPIVGRKAEQSLIIEKLQQVQQGTGQIIGISGEAGVGKTRLVAEIVRLAQEHNISGYGGECESYGTNISYLVWQPIWRAIFELDGNAGPAEQIQHIQTSLNDIDPRLVQRLPLLGTVLNLSIPDNELTETFDAKLRKTSLESLLVDCLRHKTRQVPLLLVLEDAHWLDPLSHDLLEVVGRTIADLPVLMVLVYRPPDETRLQAQRVSLLPHFTEIKLTDFTPEEAEQLIQLKLSQFFGTETHISSDLISKITERAQGNPFYIEELLNYLHAQGIDPQNHSKLERIELPNSLHSLILSRLDQLSESQKITLKLASVIGRIFRAALLWGLYPELGDPGRVEADLETLTRLELTAIDTPHPELTYFFRHIVTQEVAYESLPFATRALLHEQLARFIEQNHQENLDQYINLLAFHYEQSNNEAKKREYLYKAGEAAQADYANEAAITYYQRTLSLLPGREKIEVMLRLGEVLQLMGRWDEAGQLYDDALSLATHVDDQPALAWCRTALAELQRKQGLYVEAWDSLQAARIDFEALNDQTGVAQTLHYGGTLAAQQGDYQMAQTRYEESLTIRRQLNDEPRIASLLSNLGILAQYQGNFDEARRLYGEGLEIRSNLGDKWAIAISLNNLGYLSLEVGDFATARAQLQDAVNLQREVGDRWAIANALNNLGNAIRAQGEFAQAFLIYRESLQISQELGDRGAIAYLLEDIGGLAAVQTRYERAVRLVSAAENLRSEIGAPLAPNEQEKLLEMLAPAREALAPEAYAAAEEAGRNLSLDAAIAEALQHNQ